MAETADQSPATSLEKRVEFLEKSTQWHLFALELLASLEDLHSDSLENFEPGQVFAKTRKFIARLADLNAQAFFLVSEDDSNFRLTDCDPPSAAPRVQDAVDFFIESGTFAWALKYNRALLMRDKNSTGRLILNALATKNKVRGMYVGLLNSAEMKISPEQLTLISIILNNTTSALENAELYKVIHDHNRNLEAIVELRTLELQKQTVELKQEIEEHTRARQALDQLSRQNESILTAAGDGIFGVDLLGRITFTNPAGAHITGYGAGELIGVPVLSLIEDSGNPASRFPIRVALQSKISCSGTETKCQRKDGSLYPGEYTINPILNAGEVTGAVVTLRDITDRLKADEELKLNATELQRSNQDLQDFASIASHDLKEPLRKVIVFGGQLRQKYGSLLDEKGLDYLNRMVSATGRMQQFIEALLQYSKVSAKAQPFTRVSLRDVIDEVLSDLEMSITQSGARIDIAELPALDADTMQMYQLFMNLISNAIKYRRKEEKPVITIAAARDSKNFWAITVTDNGMGFDNKYAERIFKPFERLHGRTEFEGTGMGLAICRKIAARHGGSIAATSLPGHGSRFTISLPGRQTKGNA